CRNDEPGHRRQPSCTPSKKPCHDRTFSFFGGRRIIVSTGRLGQPRLHPQKMQPPVERKILADAEAPSQRHEDRLAAIRSGCMYVTVNYGN
ncbi:hypothetical protein, partial [Rhizobium sp. 42MFCr.1]|uniref:hypothetical protein n=1 Tax=Rhizobium sp. 42MFCr.1 TaxID=1048680 RepID=UPI001AEBCE6A